MGTERERMTRYRKIFQDIWKAHGTSNITDPTAHIALWLLEIITMILVDILQQLTVLNARARANQGEGGTEID
ncbi:MAG: hypothetical protein JW934_05685 [Anaerolineae bacterium]|nr:hypothetical protein [Anaerolineae bacterium]